ncbi:hypothetical protein GWI33_002882 [Rhynchophorus ferrugineus]|uniref:Uncharacterized protein n=1 Tax=Rhynchophorus ferrugineus TaxID=354439 RepID=A0A834IRE1_RHYFE|nr:hypothetical protein GWI33_002882 [Rhynchophorus ferrugineus]
MAPGTIGGIAEKSRVRNCLITETDENAKSRLVKGGYHPLGLSGSRTACAYLPREGFFFFSRHLLKMNEIYEEY